MPERDLVFVCPTCRLRMPYIPLVHGKKQCPGCGDPLFIVSSVYLPAEEVAKLEEELEKLITEVESCSYLEGLEARPAKWPSKL